MMLTFFLEVYNYISNEETIIFQLILLFFLLTVSYSIYQSMRDLDEQYNNLCNEIAHLKGRVKVVLAQQEPICRRVLLNKLVRCRRNLVAGYIKDLIKEQLEPEEYLDFIKDLNETSPKKQTFRSLTSSPEKSDSISKSNLENVSGQESTPEVTGFHELISSQNKNITQNNHYIEGFKAEVGRKNEFTIVKSPVESKLFKTIEGHNRRLRSSFLERRKSKIPKRNMMALKNFHDRHNENFTVFTALTSTRSPFRVKPFTKNSSQKINLSLKNSYTKQNSGMLTVHYPTVSANKQNPKENENQKTHFEDEKGAGETATTWEDCSLCSNGSSGCEGDSELDPSVDLCSQLSFNNGSVRKNIPLTTINEESAEENCPSE